LEEHVQERYVSTQGIGVYFPIVAKLPEFEEFLTAKSKGRPLSRSIRKKKDGEKRGFVPELF
jgi:hypothetical protein